MLELDDALEYDKCTICDKKFEKKHLYLDYDIYMENSGANSVVIVKEQ